MRRKCKFTEDENNYFITENNNSLFSINKSNLEFNSTNFYDVFFEKISINEEIEFVLENSVDVENKVSFGVYTTINDIFTKICQELNKSVKKENKKTNKSNKI